MKKIKLNYITAGMLLAAIPAFLLMACTEVRSVIKQSYDAVTEVVNPLTAREKYMKGLDGIPEIAQQWQQSYDTALADSLQVTLPYAEKGHFRANHSPAYSYEVALQQGEVLNAGIATDSLSGEVFIDVLLKSGSEWEHLAANDNGERMLSVPAQVGSIYKVIIQPALVLHTQFVINLSKRPLYTFPVAGKGNKDIGSFWGMERDGGKRKHEGIDIFAKRGTPVVAVTDGFISYTGERGIGGKQVWLRDGIFGAHIYYAHLDSINAVSGSKVSVGDTLGFVGNTGNARTTPPHLHFGIYRGGAVNPLPFVFKVQDAGVLKLPYSYKTETLAVKSAANLRMSPSVTAPKIGNINAAETVTLLGQSNDWLHIMTTTGQKAFLHKSLVSKSI